MLLCVLRACVWCRKAAAASSLEVTVKQQAEQITAQQQIIEQLQAQSIGSPDLEQPVELNVEHDATHEDMPLIEQQAAPGPDVDMATSGREPVQE